MTDILIADDSNIDSLVKESIELAKEIDLKIKRRREIASALEEYMIGNDRTVLVTGHNQSIIIRPQFKTAYSGIASKIKEQLISWLYENHRHLLTVKTESLLNLVIDPKNEFPFDMPVTGIALRLVDRVVLEPAVTLEHMRQARIERVTKQRVKKEAKADMLTAYHKANPKSAEPHVHKITRTRATRREAIERKARIIEDWLDGMPKSHIAKKYMLSAPYIGEMIKRHERGLVRDIRFALRDNTKKD